MFTAPTPVVTVLPSGEIIYHGHSDFVTSLAWSPDGETIASCADDKTSQTWRAATGTSLAIYRGQSLDPFSVAWSPDGKRIVSSSEDHTVRVWEAFSGKTDVVFSGHTEGVLAVAWSPDGQRIATGGGAFDDTLQILNSSTGAVLVNIDEHSSIHSLAWSPDGKQFAFSAGETIHVIADPT